MIQQFVLLVISGILRKLLQTSNASIFFLSCFIKVQASHKWRIAGNTTVCTILIFVGIVTSFFLLFYKAFVVAFLGRDHLKIYLPYQDLPGLWHSRDWGWSIPSTKGKKGDFYVILIYTSTTFLYISSLDEKYFCELICSKYYYSISDLFYWLFTGYLDETILSSLRDSIRQQ